CIIGDLGNGDAYLTIKYNSSGNTVWTQKYDLGASPTYGYAIAVDPVNNVYVTGRKFGSVSWDYFTIKYNSSGNTVWTQQYKGANADEAYGIAADASQHVYITGFKHNGLNRDYFTIVYDISGNTVRTMQYNSGNNEWARAITLDPSGNIYVTGVKDNGANNDFFTIKYDNSGNTLWTQQYNGGNADEARAIAVDSSFNIYVTGQKNNGADLDYYTIKYDSSGNTIWTQQFDSGDVDEVHGIAVDSYGNSYVTGGKNAASFNIFTIKYDSDGNTVWTQEFDGQSGIDGGFGITVDDEHYVYVTGVKTSGNNDLFTIKYLQPPYPCSLLSVLSKAEDAAELIWQDVPNEEFYLIYRSLNGATFEPIATAGKNITNYIDTGLEPLTEYYYRIVTTNQAGKSVPSNILQAQTLSITSLEEVTVGPNPFRPNTDGIEYVTFFNLPAEFEMNIYSITGAKVAHVNTQTYNGQYQWDARSSENKVLSSGVYMCHIKARGKEKLLKLIIIR
ncbi:MAG: SBBP repeat-containing protein, partial [Spirochaetes bacterium]|nr:SBBP repeat-containing protein [Spirochaetota bacterium]